MDTQGPSKLEHYSLRWNNYSANLIQVFSEHQHHETLVDVTLTCEGQFVKAHKLILSACSGFFQDMFKIHTLVQHPFIVLNGIKFNHLKHILEFIYHGEVKILDEDLEAVLALGETFQIKGLSSIKLKHQTPVSAELPQRPTSAPINTVQAEAPSVRVNEQKENIKSVLRSTNKPKDVVDKGTKNVVPLNVGVQNGREQMEPAVKRTKLPEDTTTSLPTSSKVEPTVNKLPRKNVDVSQKIPKPANAFMIFANEWRKKLTVEHPEENNKGISVMLGNMWKSLTTETKEMYYLAAKKAETEHELKYTGYAYNPQDTSKRKAARRRTIDCSSPADFKQKGSDDDDIQIIEIEEDSKDSSDCSKQSRP